MWLAVVAIGVAVYLAVYALWTARRLDRLHARVDAAAAALHAQLARRGAMAVQFSAAARLDPLIAGPVQKAAHAAAEVPGLDHDREVVEGALTRALARAVASSPESFAEPSSAATEMHDEALRATFARRFYNDTVRDAMVIRDRRVVRWLRLAGRAPHPAYFEMDDQELPVSRISVASGPSIEA